MERYLLLWKLDRSRYATDPKERGAGWNMLMEAVKKEMEEGMVTDWGVFAGEAQGFCIFEGPAEDLHSFVLKYVPFVMFETHPVLGADKTHDVIKKLL